MKKIKLRPETKAKMRTTVFWGALGSAILNFVQSIAILFGYELSQEMIGNLMSVGYSLLSLLIVAGVLVNSNKVESFEAFKVKMKK